MRSTLVALLIILASSVTQAKTWRVNSAGTGDAPTLHAAMDSAMAGDIVLVEAGHYVLTSDVLPSDLHVPPGVQLIGESGPAFTLISRDAFAEPGTIGLNNSQMRGIHVRGNTWPVLATVNGAMAEDCIIEAVGGGGLVSGAGYLEFRNCLLLGGEFGIGTPARFLTSIIMTGLNSGAAGSFVYACDVLGAVDPAVDVSDNFNFSLDPQFCGIPGSGNYFLQSASPCLPENNPHGLPVLVGPLPQGCGTVRVEQRTWGGVKALFRNP